MAPGEDGVGRRVVGLGLKEVVKGTDGVQPPVDGGDGVAQAPAVVDVGVHVVQGDSGRGFAGSGKKELQVVGVVDGGGRAGASAPRPLVESFGFGKHNSTSCGEIWDRNPERVPAHSANRRWTYLRTKTSLTP